MEEVVGFLVNKPDLTFYALYDCAEFHWNRA